MSKKTWIIFVAVVVLLFGGLIYLSSKNKIDVSKVDVNKILPATEQSGNIADQVYGNKDAKVIMIEYGDFQCPTCGSVHPNVKKVTEKYKANMAFVFRNFPIATLHPNARAAAAAAEAAGLQGKYWDVHNTLFETQSQWSTLSAKERSSYFNTVATNYGLDIKKFEADIAGDSVNQKISFDQALGKKVNVTGTPTVYMNGTAVPLETLNDQSKLDAAVAAELKKNGVEVSTN